MHRVGSLSRTLEESLDDTLTRPLTLNLKLSMKRWTAIEHTAYCTAVQVHEMCAVKVRNTYSMA